MTLLIILASLPFLATRIDIDHAYYLEGELRADHSGIIQIFFDIGSGYNEHDSSFVAFKATQEDQHIRLPLSFGSYEHLRLDPSNGSGRLVIKNLRISDQQGKMVQAIHSRQIQVIQQIQAISEAVKGELTIDIPAGSNDAMTQLNFAPILHLNPPIRWELKEWLRMVTLWLIPALIVTWIAGYKGTNELVSKYWCKMHKRPLAALALSSLLFVSLQSYPVIFLGKSFVSPSHNFPLLYDAFPAIPGSAETDSVETRGSDVAAMMDQHLNYPVVQDYAFSHGEIPLWNRFSMCGVPLLGQGQTMLGDPLEIPIILSHGSAFAWDLKFLGSRFLLCFGIGLIAFLTTESLAAAILSSAASLFVGFFLFRLIHPANFPFCYGPWIVVSWVLLTKADGRKQQAWSCLLMIVAYTLLLVCGTIKEAIVIMLCLTVAGFIHLVLDETTTWKAKSQKLLWAILAGTVFLCISAPNWRVFMHTLEVSQTAYDIPLALQFPFSHLIGIFDELILSQLKGDEWLASPSASFAILLGVLWLLSGGTKRGTGKAALAIGIACLVPLAFAFSLVPVEWIINTPFLQNIYSIHHNFSSALILLLSMLSAFGFASLLRAERTSACLRLIPFYCLFGFLLAVYFGSNSVSFSPFFAGYIIAIVLTLALAPLLLVSIDKAHQKAYMLVFVACIGCSLCWRFSQHEGISCDHYTFMPRARADLNAKSEALSEIQHRMREPARVGGLENALFLNYGSYFALESINGVDALRNERYSSLAMAFKLTRVYFWSGDFPITESYFRQLQPAYNLLNIRYFVGTLKLQPGQYPELSPLRRADMNAYENPQAWPRAFLCDEIVSYDTIESFTDLINNGDRRPVAAVWQRDKLPIEIPKTLHLGTSKPSKERLIVPASDYLLTGNTTSFTIDTPKAGIVVLTETWYPSDFKARVDGVLTPYFPVNHAFKGLYLDKPGKHRIEYEYRPRKLIPSYEMFAFGLAGCGLILALALWPASKRLASASTD